MHHAFSSQRYDQMTYRRCGTSGLMLPTLSLGCWQNFGDKSNLEEAEKLLLYAFDHGITHFDLANNYGPPPGTAETNVGRLLQKHFTAHRDELIISTKAGHYMWPGPYGECCSKKNLIASADQSLKRLGLDHVDIFYIHRDDHVTPTDEMIEALAHLIRQGKALYGGISNFQAGRTQSAKDAANRAGISLIVNQVKYSMLSRWVEENLLKTLEQNGMACMPYGPLEQGILCGKYLNDIPADSRAANPDILFLTQEKIRPDWLDKVRQLKPLADARQQSLARMALQWVLAQPTVATALIGASRVSQLEENLKTLSDPPFTAEQRQQIDAITKA